MMGRPRAGSCDARYVGVAGEDGAVKVWVKCWGGVLGVGGESTMTIRSFLCCLVGLNGERRRLDGFRRWPEDSDEECRW
jgi:hypothetical protein